jgi:2,4-dienoyl-CoA reductase-like NADH-dependent reductase (Old Yellow Enzyme family)/thioredoxin reductase
MFNYLFQRIKIGTLELKNRFVVPAMVTQYCGEDGKPNERYIAYHEAKAKGGWGLIITEATSVEQSWGSFLKQAGIWEDGQIDSHRIFTDRIHVAGGKVCCQIYHPGMFSNLKRTGGRPAQAPSALRAKTRTDVPKELTVAEIETLIEKFGDAALRAQKAGYDMVELHGAHGYIIQEFLSSFYNKRTDRYGGSLNNRFRFLREVIENVRRKTGSVYPLQLRLSAVEYIDGGLDIAQARAIAILAEQAGVNSLDIAFSLISSNVQAVGPYCEPRATYVENAAEIKKVVSIPVIAVGRINEPIIAEALLKAGKSDLVAMGRGSLADPELPNKAREGRLDEIMYCIGCVQGCRGENWKTDHGIRCLVNPMLGCECRYDLAPVKVPKRVLIAGGGVSGLQAAVTAAQKGHKATLCEKGAELGGQWALAAMVPTKTEFQTLLIWLKNQLETLKVDVRLHTTVTDGLLMKEKPDVFLVATGSKPVTPPIPGIDQPYVTQAAEVLAGRVNAGSRVAIIGGGAVGAETAEFIAKQGGKAFVIEMLPQLAQGAEPWTNAYLFVRLSDGGVEAFTETTCTEIEEGVVRYVRNGVEGALEGIDQVIIAVGVRKHNTLAEVGERLGIRTISIGDANGVKDGLRDIREAFDTAMAL